MRVEIKAINRDNLADLFSPCAKCIYWEGPDRFSIDEHGQPVDSLATASQIKKDWFIKTNDNFGICGLILYIEGESRGYAQFAPPRLLPNVAGYSPPLSPPTPDAVLISCLFIQEKYQRQGLGRQLLQAIMDNLQQRGFQVVETYARDDSSNNCSGSTIFYLRNGFTVIETRPWDQATFSLMRRELGG